MSDASFNQSDDKIPKVPWNPWAGLLFAILVYYGAQLLSGILLSAYPGLRHWTQSQALAWLDSSVTAQFAFVFLAEAFTLLGLFWFLRRYKTRASIIGLKKPRWLDPVYGVAALPLYIILYLATVTFISHIVPSLKVDQVQELGFKTTQDSSGLLLTFISLVILPPLAEEIMIRGFLYSTLKKAVPTIWAVLLTSAIFASAHLPEGGKAGPLYIAAIDTFVLSLVLIYLREKTGSLWPCITLHALKNGIAFVALFVLHAR